MILDNHRERSGMRFESRCRTDRYSCIGLDRNCISFPSPVPGFTLPDSCQDRANLVFGRAKLNELDLSPSFANLVLPTAQAPSISKAFGTPGVALNGTTSLSFTIT